MKKIYPLLAALLLAAFAPIGQTAGGPMNEDLSGLRAGAQKAVDAGKAGDAATFVKETEALLAQSKALTASASQQRITGKLKTAVALGQTGKLDEGVKAVEGAMTDMKKSGPPKFGGGSE